MTRNVPDFIDAFEQCSRDGSAPEKFRRWAAIACINGALERRCWAVTRSGPINNRVYPTFGLFTIARSGVGKSTPMVACEKLWLSTSLGDYISPKSLSNASFYDRMMKNRRLTSDGSEYHSVLIICPEILTFFVSDYDPQQLSSWGSAIDCVDVLDQQRRTQGKNAIGCVNPCLSFYLAGTPGAFNRRFPEAAYDQGIMGRSIIVYGEEPGRSLPPDNSPDLWAALREDIDKIANLEGEFTVDEDAIGEMNAEDARSEEIIKRLPHPRLEGYYNRRHVHGMKVAMALSVARSDDMHITRDHYLEAMGLLKENEPNVRKAFQTPKQDEDALSINELILNFREMGKVRVKLREIYQWWHGKVTPAKIPMLVDTMLNAGMLKKTNVDGDFVLAPEAELLEEESNVEELKYAKEQGQQGSPASKEA